MLLFGKSGANSENICSKIYAAKRIKWIKKEKKEEEYQNILIYCQIMLQLQIFNENRIGATLLQVQKSNLVSKNKRK